MGMPIPTIGDIYSADLPYEVNVQSGKRPVIIAQNNLGNKHSPTVHVIPLTTNMSKAESQATHVVILADEKNGLAYNSVALIENLRPIPMKLLLKKIGSINQLDRRRLGNAIRVQLPFVG